LVASLTQLSAEVVLLHIRSHGLRAEEFGQLQKPLIAVLIVLFWAHWKRVDEWLLPVWSELTIAAVAQPLNRGTATERTPVLFPSKSRNTSGRRASPGARSSAGTIPRGAVRKRPAPPAARGLAFPRTLCGFGAWVPCSHVRASSHASATGPAASPCTHAARTSESTTF
jgi:hypothetical protein